MISDIFNEVYQENNYSIIDTLNDLKELMDTTTNEEYKYELNDFINRIAIDYNKCPNCLIELNSKSVVFNFLEYMGVPAKEYHTVLFCDNCGREFE